ncbi:MAG: heme exporter protein CcmB [Firmicutes bacterium]|nr:heme exporter protein CcmB [Bacillota bacterium]
MIVAKDLLLEVRTKDMWVAMVAFVIMVLFAFAFALGPDGRGAGRDFPGILWLAFLFAGTVGVGRSWAHEMPEDSLTGLLLAPGDRAWVFLAKTVVAFLFMLGMELLTTPAFFLLFARPWPPDWPALLLVLVLGSAGFAGVGVLLAAMAVHTRSGSVLVPVLMVPLEVPVIIAAVEATRDLLGAGANPWPWIHALMAYDVVFLALPLLIYEYVWEV